MDLGAATHPGYVRPENEDGFFASGEHAVFAVADGMGGHEHGEVASHLALEAIVQHADAIGHAHPTELPAHLHRAIQDANAAILSQAISQDARNRMGTTVVTATIHGDRLYFAHIGDSRLYLLRGELFTQLTRDHSLVQTMVDRGQITPEEAAIHPLRHQITRVVGGEDYISPEIASQALEPGDIILLCTDGLSGTVPADTMRAILAGAGTCQDKADALVQAALQAGAPDNITAVVVAYQRPRPTPEAAAALHPPLPHLSMWQTIAIILLFMLACALGFARWSYTHPQYYLGVSAQETIELYYRYIGLPMLGSRHLPDPLPQPVPLNEVKPYLKRYGNIEDGIPVKSQETGVRLLQDLVSQASAALFDQAQHAIAAGDFTRARACLNRAGTLGADPDLIDQLDKQLKKAESAPTHSRVPRNRRP